MDPAWRNSMEKQLVFPFILEDNKINGRTCVTCKNQKKCVDGGETISIDHTCGDWEQGDDMDQEQAMQEADGFESLRSFGDLMEKYNVSEIDKKLIYISCQHF